MMVVVPGTLMPALFLYPKVGLAILSLHRLSLLKIHPADSTVTIGVKINAVIGADVVIVPAGSAVAIWITFVSPTMAGRYCVVVW
jgi:hypothetical protein